MADIVCEPRLRADVLKLALPKAFTVPVSRVLPPSLNVTVPIGVPGAEEVTVAVKVTDWPTNDGFGKDVRVVVVSALLVSVR
jgi:hypothetical protein